MPDWADEKARVWYLRQGFMHCSDAHGGRGICETCDAEQDAVAALLRTTAAEARAEEREACAKVADEVSRVEEFASLNTARANQYGLHSLHDGAAKAASRIAAAIRSRAEGEG